jgi:hypothetical protein
VGRALLNSQASVHLTSKSYVKRGKGYQMTSAVAIHAGACLVAFLTIGAGGAHNPAALPDTEGAAQSRVAPVRPVSAPASRPVAHKSRVNARN